MTVTPEAKRIVVLSKGISKGLNERICVGGQLTPISWVGDKLLWKKAQKNLKKNRTSETMNKIIPIRKPVITFLVCNPWYDLSRETSRHHWALEIKIITNPNIRSDAVYRLNHLTNPVVKTIAPMEEVRGQGLFSTRWYGWFIVAIMNLFLRYIA